MDQDPTQELRAVISLVRNLGATNYSIAADFGDKTIRWTDPGGSEHRTATREEFKEQLYTWAVLGKLTFKRGGAR